MSKLKTVTVTLEKTKRKSQPWTFVIDKPGAKSKETKREYYARAWTAKRGALRMLGAWQGRFDGGWYDSNSNDIVFKVSDHTKRKAPAMTAKAKASPKLKIGQKVTVNAGVCGEQTAKITGFTRHGDARVNITSGKHKGHEGYWPITDITTK